MNSLSEISQWHPRSLQKWLREIEENDIILVMPHLPKDISHLILENLSSRVRKLVIESTKGNISTAKKVVERAKERILEIANDLIDMGEVNEPGEPEELTEYSRQTSLPPVIGINNTTNLIKSLTTLGKYSQERGLLALEEAFGKIADPFLRDGLQLIIDGTDPDLVEEILRNKVEAITYHRELLYNLMIEGILGIQAGNSSWTLEMRLKSHLPPEMGEEKSVS
ncbi:MAG: hypothetical protein OEV44_02585 [Spirochaetota bacterium]|nr:hypothetical protein [Spirochaetota bacterium]